VEERQLGASKITGNNRIYIPPSVVGFLKLKIGDFLSFEINENNIICVFKGSLRIARKNSNCKPNKGDGEDRCVGEKES